MKSCLTLTFFVLVVSFSLRDNGQNVIDLDSLDEAVEKHDYDGFKSRRRGIRVHELWDYIHDRKKNGNAQLNEEFRRLKSGLTHPHTIAKLDENKQKNRYRGLYAYDHNRVSLIVEEDKLDYINASFINGFGKISKFIAAQGPNSLTVNDFWSMIWQQGSAQIVMLTNLTEKGAEKCVQYWPDIGLTNYGYVIVKLVSSTMVKLVSTQESSDFTIRELEIWRPGKEVRNVTQYHFEGWPDKEIPDNTWSLVEFWRTLMKDYDTVGRQAGPILVHCSAGVGRTGTFIAIDNLFQQAQMEGCVTPFNAVNALRDQRVHVVQTKEQYVFLHEAVADTVLFGTHDIKSNHLPQIYGFLLENDEKTPSLTRLAIQHQLILGSRIPPISDLDTIPESFQEGPDYSKLTSFKPADKMVKDSETLSTINLPYHSGQNGFILVNKPPKESTDQLWSLITDRNVKTIISLSGPFGEESKTKTILEVHNSNVEVVDERVTINYMAETFKIPQTTNSQETTFNLAFFELKNWDDQADLPTSTSSILECLETIRVWQHQLSDSQPVLIICRDNIPNAGLLCALLCELDRCSGSLGKVNIVETVKLMRACHPGIVATLKQYKFIFDVLTYFVQHQCLYQHV